MREPAQQSMAATKPASLRSLIMGPGDVDRRPVCAVVCTAPVYYVCVVSIEMP